MAENQTRPTKESVTAFIEKIADPTRRGDAKKLSGLLQKLTKEKPVMWGPAIVGFGSYQYVYETGREGDMPLVSFSPRKAAMAVYLQKDFAGAMELLAKLGQKPTGCMQIKSLDKVDEKALAELVTKSVAATRKKHS